MKANYYKLIENAVSEGVAFGCTELLSTPNAQLKMICL